MEYRFIRVRPKKTDPFLWKASYETVDDGLSHDNDLSNDDGLSHDMALAYHEVILVDVIAHAYGIKKDQVIDAHDFEQMMEENLAALCRYEGMKIVHRSSQCRRGVQMKLAAKGFSRSLIEEVLKGLENEGYIDDLRFAEGYISMRGHRESKRALEEGLRRKGLSSDVIRQAIQAHMSGDNETYGMMSDGSGLDEEEQEVVKALAYLKRKKPPCLEEMDRETRFKTTQKFFAGLARKGFSGSVSKRAFQRWLEEDGSDNDSADD